MLSNIIRNITSIAEQQNILFGFHTPKKNEVNELLNTGISMTLK